MAQREQAGYTKSLEGQVEDAEAELDDLGAHNLEVRCVATTAAATAAAGGVFRCNHFVLSECMQPTHTHTHATA